MIQKLSGMLVLGLVLVGCNAFTSNGDQLFEDGKYKEAAEAYTAQIEQQGNDLGLIYNRGRAYEEMGDLKSATQDYNYILEKDPKHLNANLSLAKLAYEKKDYAKCLLLSET
jgi:tetratricopeptide (TPR) repeat protein